MMDTMEHTPFGRIRAFWLRHERRATTLAFLAGFVLDSLTLRRVDLWLENVAFLVYLAAAGIAIVFLNAYDGGLPAGQAGRLAGRRGSGRSHWLPAMVQFAFGALLSGFFVFYSRSASLVASWPFLLLLILLLVGNERFFRVRYVRMPFQVSVFFFVALSYAIALMPVIVGRMGTSVFLLSGIVGLALTWILCRGLRWAAAARYRDRRRAIIRSVAAVYLAFHLLYLANILPPIPLALKDIGVYHAVSRLETGDYRALSEPVPWYDLRGRLFPVFRRAPGEAIYVWSAVFAPTRLSAPILHRWSRFDEERGEWVELFRLGFTISGGRDGGYRGYSFGRVIPAGRARVDVITARGALIGRATFRVEDVPAPVPLREETR